MKFICGKVSLNIGKTNLINIDFILLSVQLIIVTFNVTKVIFFVPFYSIMKTSRTNSFRLHLINKSGSVRKPSQTFYDPDQSVKFAALNSVTRGIKHADLSFMTGKDLNKLRVQPLESNEGQYHSAHFNLTEVRKKYDEMKKQRVLVEEKIAKQKEEIGKFTIFKTQYEDKINQAKQKVANLKTQLQDKKLLLEETSTEKKILLSMQWRHKTDKICYDQRKFDCEKELSFLRKQLSIFNKSGLEIGESQDRTSKVYQKLAKQLESEKQERDAHIKNLENMIEEKLQLLNTNHEREADLYEIAERAIQDKDLNEKNWRKIFLTHIFVNKMLRNKIEKEMQKFRIVEFAFKEIKTATGVSDAKTLVQKYLNKQAVYGELLGKIAENQKAIQNLKGQTEDLNQQSKNLEMELQVLHSIKIKSQDLHDNIKEFEEYDAKSTTSEYLRNKMGQWAVRQLKKMNISKKDEVQQPKSLTKLVQVFEKLLAILKEESDKEPIQVSEQYKAENVLNNKQNEKNTRIIPKKSRVNSIGEEIFDADQQETNHNSHMEQNEVINTQRDELLRNNEKFMKQMKKKMDDERKLLIDKHESKNKSPVKVAEVKKQQD